MVKIDAELLGRIRQIWDAARSQAARSVNPAHVGANRLIGQQIVEAEQGGAERAEYGSARLRHLSAELAGEYGGGFSASALQYMRAFYLAYPELLHLKQGRRVLSGRDSSVGSLDIRHAVRVVSAGEPGRGWKSGRLHPALSWTHYRALLKVGRREVRDFYEIEAVRSGWSARQLERQINSLLFERLLKSRYKAGVLALANECRRTSRRT